MKSQSSVKTPSAVVLALALAMGIPATATAHDLSAHMSAQFKADYKSDLKSYKAQLTKLAGAEAEIINGWASVSGDNYTSDEVMYAKLKVLLPKISKFIAKLEAISPRDSKIYKAHAGYVAGWNLQSQGFTTWFNVLKSQDSTQVAVANGYLAKGRAKINAFVRTLKTL
jgi:hypothetical protein